MYMNKQNVFMSEAQQQSTIAVNRQNIVLAGAQQQPAVTANNHNIVLTGAQQQSPIVVNRQNVFMQGPGSSQRLPAPVVRGQGGSRWPLGRGVPLGRGIPITGEHPPEIGNLSLYLKFMA